MAPSWNMGPLTPDLPPTAVGGRGCLRADNMLPAAIGYAPMPRFNDLGVSAVPGRPLDSVLALDSSQGHHFYLGTDSHIYVRTGSGWTQKSQAPGYSLAPRNRWKFVHYGPDVIAFADAQNPQYLPVGSGSLFADLPDSPPQARWAATVHLHLMVGNLGSASPFEIRWPAIGNAHSWPTPGTQLAIAGQAGAQELQSRYGEITAIVGGETGAIFQRKAITNASYIGGDVIYDVDRQDDEHGCFFDDVAIPLGNEILFLAEDGWRMYDFAQSYRVGKDAIDRTFLAELDEVNATNIRWIRHPKKTVVFILYPGPGNVDGRPNRILAYDWELRRFSFISWEGWILSELIESSDNMDTLPADSMDDPSLPSLDTPEAGGLVPQLGGVSDSLTLGAFTGSAMDAIVESGDIEMVPGRFARLDEAVPLVSSKSAERATLTAQVSSRDDLDEIPVFGPEQARNPGGRHFDFDEDEGRYHRVRLNLRGPWDTAFSMELRGHMGGRY